MIINWYEQVVLDAFTYTRHQIGRFQLKVANLRVAKERACSKVRIRMNREAYCIVVELRGGLYDGVACIRDIFRHLEGVHSEIQGGWG